MSESRTTEAVVTTVNDMQPGTMKMAKVGERRIAVIRTATGFHAIDNACPHQGYGLVTGALEGELVTCQWHNWKYRVTDGVCVQGEEDVACHAVRLDGDDVVVSVTEPTREEQLATLWPSLRNAIDRFYTGQIARDTSRLLIAGATPDEIVADALTRGIPRAEWGLGHETAGAADLLTLADDLDGLDKALPVVQALAGISEEFRDRPAHADPQPVDAPADQAVFVDAIEREDWPTAAAALRALGDPIDVDAARRWLIEAVSRHHYDYGHGAIYLQKCFELIERVPALAPLLTEELALGYTMGTREDTLPYMRKAMQALETIDLDALADAAGSWPDGERDRLVDLLLEATEAPLAELAEAATRGAGVPGLLDVVSLAASRRLLRYDVALEYDGHDTFGWLDITHALTYCNAARWAWRQHPSPATARLALFTAFLAFDSGRGDRRPASSPMPTPEPRAGDVADAIRHGRSDDAVAHALAGDPDKVAGELERVAMLDGAGSFIVAVHLVKTAVAARREAEATGSPLPLAGTARFMAGPRTERFVARNTFEAVRFIETGQPPKR